MRTNWARVWWIGVVLVCGGTAQAQTTNSWRALSGKWELGTNWSINLPPTNNSFVFITNTTTKTVTIDATTTNAANLPTMTITNLSLSAPGGSANTLLMSDSGTNVPLRIANAFTITSGGVLQISNGIVRIDNAGAPTTRMINDGEVWLHTTFSRLVNTNGNLHIGNSAPGLMTVSNGTVLAEDVIIGNTVGGNGTLTLAGGTNVAIGAFSIGGSSSGTVWVTGGRLVVTNTGPILIGNGGIGRLTLSNGTVLAPVLRVGNFNGGRGTLTIAGGTNSISSTLSLAFDTNTTAAVWLTGGRLLANSTTIIGVGGMAQMTISNGVFLANAVGLGTNFTGIGTISVAGSGSLTAAGGIAAMTGPLEIGLGGTGTVNVLSGGLLAVTNTPATVTSGTGLLIDGSVTLTNRGAIIVSNVTGIVVGNRGSGSLTMKGGSLSTIVGNLTAGFTANANGSIWINGSSSINMTNPGSSLFLGTQGIGQMTLSNGTVNVDNAIVGNVGSGVGTLTVAGGTMAAPSGFDVGESAGSTGAVWMTGGTLLATNLNQLIGNSGVGQMTVSNGVVRFRRVLIGLANIGTVTIAGGTNSVSTELLIGSSNTGTLWLTGGQLLTTNAAAVNIGRLGIGRMTVSNGTWLATNAVVGAFTGSQGTLTVAGGNSTVSSNLTVGRFACDSTAIVNVNAGTLAVTNSAVNAVLDVRGGTLTVSGGTLRADLLYVTNACARLIKTGGILSVTTTNLPAGLDADGDGVPNGVEQANGDDPFNPGDSTVDSDGDGLSDVQETLAGTSPTDSASSFRIISATRQTTDVVITWKTAGGRTNAVQATAGGANGSYSTNSFSDISGPIILPGSGDVNTNYVDTGGGTNSPSRFYRVRLVP